ncbi:unnamed protein product [Peniophora sp. CBMAI 1063]|nr:unnamed protein product [Peniophora sp. CBMAI 1063]
MRAALLPSLLAAVVQAQGAFKFGAAYSTSPSQVPLQLAGGHDWDTAPSEHATGHLLFDSVSSLMQRWPNTVVRPGHTIVPALIPAGTILYHGLPTGSSLPPHPDWLAFSFTHAYEFAGGPDGHVITLSTSRPLRLLYFDGSSAAKVRDGSYDTQEVVMWGEVRDEGARGARDDVKILERLCEWGVPRGVDGFVRMEYHFEVMQCNLTSGLTLLASSPVLPQQTPHYPSDPQKPRPPTWRGSLPSTNGESRVEGKWADRAPGETRVWVLYDRLSTFYDPALTSLFDVRRGRPRELHRLKGISKEEAGMKLRELEDVAAQLDTNGWDAHSQSQSGVDWASITHVVVERYAQRLELLSYTLSSSSSYPSVRARASKARAQVLTMLAPYFTTADSPRADDDVASKGWLAPVVQRCSTTHTAGIPASLLTPQERLIRDAVADVTREICRRLGRMFHAAFDVEDPALSEEEVRGVVGFMQEEVDALMGWLDWTSVWLGCRPACSIEEMCVVPTWPFEDGEDENDTRHPRCVRLPNV